MTTGIVGSGGTAGEAGLTGVDGGNGGYNARGESGEIGPPRSGGSVLGPPGGANFTLRIFNVAVFVLPPPRWYIHSNLFVTLLVSYFVVCITSMNVPWSIVLFLFAP